MKKNQITSVLIANRGEITIRIAKTLQRLGIRVFALTTDFDQNALHTEFADVVLKLKGETLKETYLNAQQMITLAQQNQIDAIHPGYGFLSENSTFAKMCEDAKITFIGPSSAVIDAMGSKAHAKKLMQKAGVPVIPGYHGDDQKLTTLIAESEKIGYPLLIKASAGGGGKGMRVVRSAAEFEKALVSAKSESLKSFGDDRLIIEKFVENPRHVEFQIFGDVDGNLIHLGERDCSIQRRHQKIIEETPSGILDETLRTRMAAAAVACGKSLHYTNAGTVEFIVNDQGEFYFLEVNTRLQVEHPITEWRTGFDLVEWQVRVAEGQRLPVLQDELRFSGHSLECRIYAEDAENQFLPSTGKILLYQEPTAPFLRVDSSVTKDSEITVNFDPMIAKVSVYGHTRAEAISRMIWALENYPILGVKTNTAFLLTVLQHASFQKDEISTHFIEKHFPKWCDEPSAEHLQMINEIVVSGRGGSMCPPTNKGRTHGSAPANDDVWHNVKNFRLGVQ